MSANEEFDKKETTILASDQVADVPTEVEVDAELVPVVSEELESTMLQTTSDPLDLQSDTEQDVSTVAINQATAEVELGENELEETTYIAEALEQYSALLKASNVSGLTPQSVKFLKVGFEHIDKFLGTTELVSGLETYSGDSVLYPKECISLESKMNDFVTKLIERIKKVFTWLMDRIATLYKKYTLGINKLDNVLKECQTAIKDLKFVPNTEVKFSNVDALSINGKVDLNDTRAITGLTRFVTDVYPKALLANYKSITDRVKGIDPVKDDIKEIVNELRESLVRIKDVPGQHGDSVFPGNNKLVVGETPGTYSIVHDEDATELKEYEYIVESKQDMEIRLKAIGINVEMLMDSTVKNRRVMDSLKEAKTALESLISKIDASDDIGDDKAALVGDLNTIMGMIKDNAPSMTSVMAYVIRTLGMYLMVARTEIKLMSPNATSEE